MKINSLAINMAKSFDTTINNVVKMFYSGSAIVNTSKLSKLGKEYKVASLLKELSNNNGEISEGTLSRVIDSVFGDTQTPEIRTAMRKQFTEDTIQS
jgi:hypothetical protein